MGTPGCAAARSCSINSWTDYRTLRQNVRSELLAESRKHKAAKLLRQIPCIGPIRAARLIALMQTPYRLRRKRQLWTYSGLGIENHDSAQFRFVRGQLQHSKKPQQLRGLNQNHNHEMKEIFKSAATRPGCATSRALCEGVEFHTAKNHRAPPNFFHHIFLVRSSQTYTTVAAKIPRQCTIENCASLQRRLPAANFSPLFDNIWPRSAPPQMHAKKQNSMLSPIF